jgi:hypothetical protein
VLGPEQLAYLGERHMPDGQAVINRAHELFRSKKLKGIMACVDFRAAFDSCKHGFIWQALERFNVGPNLIHHMQTLYQGAKSSVLNDNTPTNWFPLTQSTRQGDPVAGYTFILLMEVLLNKIKHEIPALTVDNFSVGCIAYADNLTVFLRTAKSCDAS